jgi:hypothetical protein
MARCEEQRAGWNVSSPLSFCSLPPGSTDCTAPPRGAHQELATDRHRRPTSVTRRPFHGLVDSPFAARRLEHLRSESGAIPSTTPPCG